MRRTLIFPARGSLLVDAQDFAILTHLFQEPRASYGELGGRVGLSANAVKARLRRLGSEGVLQGVQASPRPDLLGLRTGFLVFTGIDDLDEREDEILQALPEVPGVRAADVAVDHAVYVSIAFRDDADWERIERAAISLVGKPPARHVKGPPAERAEPLAPADVRILRALLPDGRQAVKDLAARAGLTFKPLKKRLDALLRTGRVQIQPVLSATEASGAVLFRILLLPREGVEPSALARLLPHDAIVTVDGPLLSAYLQRPTLREARAVAKALRGADGVERAFFQLATRRASTAWMDEALARVLEAPVPPPAPAPVPLARAGR